MKKLFLGQTASGLLVLLLLVFSVYGWYVFSLALFGIFFFPLVLAGSLVCGGAALVIGGRMLSRSSGDIRIALAAAALYALFIFFVSEPTVFSGRDQGSISEAAYRLADNGTLIFSHPAAKSFFEIYGPGTALNFPGFSYTEAGDLITQFPLAYTAYAASFVSLFGLSGFSVANALLFFLFLFVFYSLLRLFAAPFYAFFGLALASLSFLPSWFAKFTLSENLALLLFVGLLYGLFQFYRHSNAPGFALALGSAGLLAFTRIEGFTLLLLTLGLLAFSRQGREFWRRAPWLGMVLPALVFLFLFLRDFFMNLPYYKMIGKALFKFLHGFGNDVFSEAGLFSANSGATALGPIFFSYGLLVLFSAGFFSLLVFLKEKKYFLLIPAFLALPTFLYLYTPTITPDHPWMLRRFLFTLFPVFLFSTVLGTALLFAPKNEKTLPLRSPEARRLPWVALVFIVLLSFQVPAWWKSIAFAENRGLLGQVTEFSQVFGERDLVLVDRFATGSGFAMLAGPGQYLSGKNIVYFFNPQDILRLDGESYDRVYLVVPNGESARYSAVLKERMRKAGSITFTLEQFALGRLAEHGAAFPEKETLRTQNLIFEILK